MERLSTVVREVHAACGKGERIVVVVNSVCVDTLRLRRFAMVLSVQESFAYGAFGPLLLDAEEDEDSEKAEEEPEEATCFFFS